MNFPHLQGREKLLEPLGFSPRQAEWTTPASYTHLTLPTKRIV